MYRHTRTGKIKDDKFQEGVQFAKEIAEYCSKYVPVSVYVEMFGKLNFVHWCADYKDLASLEAVKDKLMSDPGYWEFGKKVSELFVEGSFHDTLLMAV